MESWTLGEISVAVALMVALVTGIGVLVARMKSWIKGVLKDQLDEIRAENRDLKERIDKVDMNTTKNYLVARLSEMERGETLDEIGMERFWEEYEHYSDVGGNSYIKRKVEQLKADGRL